MKSGKIASLGDRSSGLIKVVGVKEGVFFHADCLEGVSFGELKTGDKVSFETTESKKGQYATKVKRA